MTERTNRSYREGEIGDVRIVEDFLPPPDQLVLREDNVKVTLSLSRASVDFFKREARKVHVPYQRMIRSLVHSYAARNEKKTARGARKSSRRKKAR
jgi:predicted DNA binding CopG/RHH family protein